MADPKELEEAADAIRRIRGLPAVQRHKELDEPLREAEEWARKEYRKVRERNGDRNAGDVNKLSPPSTEITYPMFRSWEGDRTDFSRTTRVETRNCLGFIGRTLSSSIARSGCPLGPVAESGCLARPVRPPSPTHGRWKLYL